ncbi:hypothetical protein BC830DRAFT_1082946 [Chytriomyces sp. MP71]|nr:hypothetical protein BC830DRAFT_1082946 [Chytriomyces sp. MP71]
MCRIHIDDLPITRMEQHIITPLGRPSVLAYSHASKNTLQPLMALDVFAAQSNVTAKLGCRFRNVTKGCQLVSFAHFQMELPLWEDAKRHKEQPLRRNVIEKKPQACMRLGRPRMEETPAAAFEDTPPIPVSGPAAVSVGEEVSLGGPDEAKPGLSLPFLPYEVLVRILLQLTPSRRVAVINSCARLRESVSLRSEVLFSFDEKRFLFLAAIGDLRVVRDHFECVVATRQRLPEYVTSKLFATAARYGHLGLLQYLVSVYQGRVPMARDSSDQAAAGGHVEVLEYLLQFERDRVSCGNALVLAAGSGQLETVNWLLQHGYVVTSDHFLRVREAVDAAAKGGHLNVIHRLVAVWRAGLEPLLTLNTSTFATPSVPDADSDSGVETDSDSSLLRGQLDVPPPAAFVPPVMPCTVRAMDNACKFGHFQVVEYLTEVLRAPCSKDALDQASGHGHLAVVQYLHKRRKEGGTSKGMDFACLRGHLEVVKFLHEKRSEGCTSDALNYAASRGNLAIVKYLVKCRSEGRVADAIRFAQRAGHSPVVSFLASINYQRGGGGRSVAEGQKKRR